MGKRYMPVGEEVHRMIDSVRKAWYEKELEGVDVGALFVRDEDGVPCLSHHGYPAAGICRIVSSRDRAAGMTDAQIILDFAIWGSYNAKQQKALIDHELHHIERVLDNNGVPKIDAQDRPKLKIRKHDWQFGWFDEIANRHGEASAEVMQAKLICQQSGQLYFDFKDQAA